MSEDRPGARTSATSPAETRTAAAAPGVGKGESFPEHAERVLGALQRAFAEVVDAGPEPVRRAVDLQRALGVDAPLAWRVFKVAMADDPLLAATYVPTRGQLLTLIEAAVRRSMPAGVLTRMRAAIEGYEEFLRVHAGDRDALDAMIAALRPSAAGQIDEKTRRIAFKQNSQIWGLQAQAAVRAFILHPGPDQSTFGTAAIAGLVGLHAVRPDVPLVVHATALYEGAVGAGDPARHAYRAEDRSGLLLNFSSPGVEFRTEVGDDQTLVTRVCAPGIGRRAAVTTFSLTVSELPAGGEQGKITLSHGTLTPVEVCHLELLAPAGLTDPSTARAAVYGRRTRVEKAYERRPADLLPIHEPVVHVGALRDVPPISGIPRWPEVVRHVLGEIGAYGARFDVYRCRVPYPVLHTLVSMQVDAQGRGAPA